jgi:hypothetical protein
MDPGRPTAEREVDAAQRDRRPVRDRGVVHEALLSPAADRAAAQALGTTSIMLYLSIALAAQRFATLSRSRAAAAPRFRAVSF